MRALRLPGSWRGRFNALAALCGAAAVAGEVGLSTTHGNPGWPFLQLYWSWLLGGLGGVVLRAVLQALEWRGRLEFTGPEEESLLRSRRVLSVGGGGRPLRAPAEEGDDTPGPVKFFAVLAVLAWCAALPLGNVAALPVEVRFWFLWAAVVPTAAAAFLYAVHQLRGAVRLVGEASEDR